RFRSDAIHRPPSWPAPDGGGVFGGRAGWAGPRPGRLRRQLDGRALGSLVLARQAGQSYIDGTVGIAGPGRRHDAALSDAPAFGARSKPGRLSPAQPAGAGADGSRSGYDTTLPDSGL